MRRSLCQTPVRNGYRPVVSSALDEEHIGVAHAVRNCTPVLANRSIFGVGAALAS